MNASPPAAASYNKLMTPRKRRSRAAPGSQEPVPKKPRADVVEARGRPSLADATKAPAPAVDQPPEAPRADDFSPCLLPAPAEEPAAPEPAETIMFEEQPPSEQISILQQFPESFVDRAVARARSWNWGDRMRLAEKTGEYVLLPEDYVPFQRTLRLCAARHKIVDAIRNGRAAEARGILWGRVGSTADAECEAALDDLDALPPAKLRPVQITSDFLYALPPAAKLRPVQLTIESRECMLAKYIRQAKAARVDVAEGRCKGGSA